MKEFSKKLNYETASQNEKLLSYEYCGGIYPMFIVLICPFTIVAFITTIVLFVIQSIYTIIPKIVNFIIFSILHIPTISMPINNNNPLIPYIALALFLTLLFLSGLVVLVNLYVKNKGTCFSIYNDRIEGIAKIKGAGKMKVNLPFEDIDELTFSATDFNIISKGKTYSIMITSHGFMQKLKSIIAINK